MSNVSEIISKFDGHLVKPDLFLDDPWFEEHGNVSWNSENNIEDLINGDGHTYSECSYGEAVEMDGHVLFTLGDSCGGQGQAIFNLNNKIDPEDFA